MPRGWKELGAAGGLTDGQIIRTLTFAARQKLGEGWSSGSSPRVELPAEFGRRALAAF